MSDVNEIKKLYKNGLPMREIGRRLDISYKTVSYWLKKNGIATRPPKNLRGKKIFQSSTDRQYHNMATHLRFDVDYLWLKQFNDFEKLKFLNKAITNRSGRYNVDTNWYKKYIQKFYYDKQFNKIYNVWVESDCNKWLRPTIDHINPKANEGGNNLDNLQFLSWLENRSKSDIPQVEWNIIKNNLSKYFIYE